MEDHQPRLHGVITTFRRTAELKRALRLLGNQKRILDRLVVVDNDPVPGNKVAVDSYRSRGFSLDYLAMEENLGPAGGIALAMERILGSAEDRDWVVLFDDDDPPTGPLTLSSLLLSAESIRTEDPRLGGVGLAGARIDWRRGRLRRVEEGLVEYLWSDRYPLYSVGALRWVTEYPKELFFGFEELEFGLRLSDAGFALRVVNPTALGLREDEGRPSRPSFRLGPTDWRRYYSLRNFIHILRDRGHPMVAVKVSLIRGIGKPLANMVVSPRLAWRHLQANATAIRDGWLSRLGQVVEPDGHRRSCKAGRVS